MYLQSNLGVYLCRALSTYFHQNRLLCLIECRWRASRPNQREREADWLVLARLLPPKSSSSSNLHSLPIPLCCANDAADSLFHPVSLFLKQRRPFLLFGSRASPATVLLPLQPP